MPPATRPQFLRHSRPHRFPAGRNAIILPGKRKSTHFLSPGVVQITLVLKNKSSVDQDDRHFGPPFLLAVDELFANVRNRTAGTYGL